MSSHTDLNVEGLSNHELASQVISKYTGKSSSANNNKRKSQNVVKDDNEYMKKRARNNVAVKKSREKAKNRIQDTQIRVEQLSKENEELQTKVNLLSKELNVLRALFTNGGFTLPSELQCGGSPPPSEHSMPPSMSSYHGRLSSDDGPPSLPKTSPLHSSYIDEKPTYHSSMDENPINSKIPPLRPMPRNPSGTLLSSSHSSIPSSHSPLGYNSKRLYMSSKPEYPSPASSTKEKGSSGPPLLIQPGPQSVSNNHSSSQLSKGDTRHPSVIRSTTDITTVPSTSNMLGKFCIIKDQGDIKVVPMNG